MEQYQNHWKSQGKPWKTHETKRKSWRVNSQYQILRKSLRNTKTQERHKTFQDKLKKTYNLNLIGPFSLGARTVLVACGFIWPFGVYFGVYFGYTSGYTSREQKEASPPYPPKWINNYWFPSFLMFCMLAIHSFVNFLYIVMYENDSGPSSAGLGAHAAAPPKVSK